MVRAVDGVSFTLGHGEVLGLVGESGSGKTVTCRALIRLLPGRRARIVAGRARLEGTDLLALDEAQMTAGARRHHRHDLSEPDDPSRSR